MSEEEDNPPAASSALDAQLVPQQTEEQATRETFGDVVAQGLDAQLVPQQTEEQEARATFDSVFAQAFAEEPVVAVDPDLPRMAIPGRRLKKARVEGESGHVEVDSSGSMDLVGKWAALMNSLKPKRALTIKENDAGPYIQSFIQEMINVADLDDADFKEGKPMLHKLAMLDRAVDVMSKFAFMEYFISYDGCKALARWMKCLPNGDLPSIHIRSALLRCMDRLPITKESLANCGELPLGAAVANLQQNPRETVDNRIKAAALVQKWLKQVLSKQRKSFDLDADAPAVEVDDESDAEVEETGNLVRPPAESEDTIRAQEEESMLRMHPIPPAMLIGGKDYVIMPAPKHMPLKRATRDKESNRGKLQDALTIMSRPNKQCWKPYAPSVAGRGINMV